MTLGHVVSPIILTSAELLINKNLTIQGPGANLLTVQRSAAGGAPHFRIFNIQSGTVNISGLTVTNGYAPDVDVNQDGAPGGGIHNSGTLTLMGVTVSGNRAGVGGHAAPAPTAAAATEAALTTPAR